MPIVRRPSAVRLRIALATSIFVLAACSPSSETTQSAASSHLYAAPVVLFVGPDSARIEALKVEGEDDFYTAADDEMWYRAEAYPLLDSLRIRYDVVDRAPMRFRVGGEAREYAWRDVALEWFVVLYDGVHEPKVSASVDLPAEIRHLRR